MFSCKFYEISKGTFFTEHLQATASDFCVYHWWHLENFRYYKVTNNFHEGYSFLPDGNIPHAGKGSLEFTILKPFKMIYYIAQANLTILTGKKYLNQLIARIYWNRNLAASDLFRMFAQTITSDTFHCHIFKVHIFKQGDSSIRQKMKGCLFQQPLPPNLSWFLS